LRSFAALIQKSAGEKNPRSDQTVAYRTPWIIEAGTQRPSRASVFHITVRIMACFVVVANFLYLIQAGPLSLLGYVTILFLLVAGLELAFSTRATLTIFGPLFFWVVFVAWLCISFAISGIAVPQPPIANAALIAIMALSGINAWADPREACTLLGILRWAFVANAGLSLLLVFTGISSNSGLGSRTLAIVAVLGLAVTLSYWRSGHPWWFLISIGVWLVPLVTLSRTAAICGALLFPLSASRSHGRRRRWTKVVVLTMVAGCTFYVAIRTVPEFENRFFFGRSPEDFINGKASLDTAGRAQMWQSVIESWSATAQTMIIGQGAGTSEDAASKGVSSMDHPHNDYLGVLHDYGIIGLSIFVTAFFLLLRGRWKAWSHAEESGSQQAGIHCAAFLMAFAFAIMMITDNPLEYFFAILPTAIVVGSSVGVEMYEWSFANPPLMPMEGMMIHEDLNRTQ
jgi:O-antigen ligase